MPLAHFRWSCLAQLTPYLEQSAVYNKIDLTVPMICGGVGLPETGGTAYAVFLQNRDALQVVIPTFLCPSDPPKGVITGSGLASKGMSNYTACGGSLPDADPAAAGGGGDGLFFRKYDRGFMWADGAYNAGLYNHTRPPNSPDMDCVQHNNPARKAARSRHTGGVNAVLGDDSVRFVRDGIDPAAWAAAATRAGGETVGLD